MKHPTQEVVMAKRILTLAACTAGLVLGGILGASDVAKATEGVWEKCTEVVGEQCVTCRRVDCPDGWEFCCDADVEIEN